MLPYSLSTEHISKIVSSCKIHRWLAMIKSGCMSYGSQGGGSSSRWLGSCLSCLVFTSLLCHVTVMGQEVATRPSSTGNQSTGLNDVSTILNLLLLNYDSTFRPEYGGKPAIVKVDLNIRSMGPISEVDMTYSMDAYFRQTWVDKRLCFNLTEEILVVHISMLDKIWKPDTYFHNGRGSYLHTITTPNKLLRIMRNGTILYSMRLTIKANCPMYLQYFPVDEQTCPLQFGSYAYTTDDVIYVWKAGPDSSIETSKDLRLSQFDMVGHPAWNLTVKNRGGGEFSALKVIFRLRRHMGYFLIQVYVPCTLLVILSWVSFWINREATADRFTLGITTVLTLTTITMDTRSDLPKVSYATALDWFVIVCFGYVIASLLEYAGVHYFTKIGSGEIVHDTDSEMGDSDEYEDEDIEEEWGYYDPSNKHINYGYNTDYGPRQMANTCTTACVTTRLMTQTALPAYLPRPTPGRGGGSSPIIKLKNGKRREKEGEEERVTLPHDTSCFVKFFRCLQGSASYRKLMQKHRHHPTSSVNSVSMIDRVSRILFPLSFIVLNVIYWIAYTR